jgi:hypothetical protein
MNRFVISKTMATTDDTFKLKEMICEVLLSIIQKKLLYEEAINKEALFCYYTKYI